MVGRRIPTVAAALGACLVLAAGVRPDVAVEPSAAGPGVAEPSGAAALPGAADPHLLRPPPHGSADPHLLPPPPPHGFDGVPRTCMVAERCPSVPCVQFIERGGRDAGDRRYGGHRRHAPVCDRFPDPGDARMVPLARP